MAIRKIKAALVNTRDATDYSTEIGYLFYDADPNGDRTLRISDGSTDYQISWRSEWTHRAAVRGQCSEQLMFRVASTLDVPEKVAYCYLIQTTCPVGRSH